MAYQGTEVPVERSQGAIRKLLAASGAASFAFAEDVAGDRHWSAVQFTHAGLTVRIRVPHRPEPKRSRVRDYEAREDRRIWRVMFHNLKARMVAVDEGVETFAEAFLAHVVNPTTNRTVFEELSDAGSIEWGGGQLALPAGE